MLPQWTVQSNTELARLDERTSTNLPLPLSSTSGITTSVISGSLPAGLRLENNTIVGTPFEVARPTTSKFVIRATGSGVVLDRTFTITVDGADEPVWQSVEGRLPVGPNGTYYILDNSFIDFQLLATDPDIPAGETLEYYIADGDGELPPGITLTSTGKLTGIIDPLLALDINVTDGGYDTNIYSAYPFDFSIPSGNGLDSFYYDTTVYDYSVPTRRPKKLNRIYEFYVTVTDNVSSSKRRFQIYVVGDDFVRSDNTLMKAADGVFTSDATYLRTPIWLTPADLGVKRANNYVTLYLDVLDTNTLAGVLRYTLEGVNDDGSPSVLPPGLVLDNVTGEITGRVPYQPAVTREYKFTVNAQRFNTEDGIVTVFGTYNTEVLSGNKTFTIAKLIPSLVDGISDLQSLTGNIIAIEGRYYTVESVDESDANFDSITLTEALQPTPYATPITVERNALVGQTYFYANTISLADQIFYKNRYLNLSETESYKIVSIEPFIEYQITLADSTGILELNTDVTGIGPSFEETLETLLGGTVTTLTSGGNIIEANLMIPSTATNRTKNYIESLFHASDSTGVVVTELGQQDKVTLDVALTVGFTAGRQFAFGTYTGAGFNKSFARAETDVIEKKKTFSVRLLGEVDSVITWLTPSDLGTLNANRVSTLFVKAQTTVPDAVLKYNLVSGSLPPGLILKDNGEIIGKTPIVGTPTAPGLTFFDSGTTTFDGATTSLDREYSFTILARDRFGFSAISREFTVTIDDTDNLTYSNIYIQPFLNTDKKFEVQSLLGNANVINPRYVYRPSDPNFGVQKNLRALVYAGIETQEIDVFVAATAMNHKRKKFLLGEVKTAVAKKEGTDDVIYEVIYLEVKDPAKPVKGKTAPYFLHKNANGKITVDSIKYESNDDSFAGRDGSVSVNITARDGSTSSVQVFDNILTVVTRAGETVTVASGNVIRITLRSGEIVTLSPTIVDPVLGSGSPWKFRPKTNTITTDSNAIKIGQSTDSKKYIASIDHMRDKIKATGRGSKEFLPLWMRTAQNGSLSELDYVLAIPLVYTQPGYSTTFKENLDNYVKTAGFSWSSINYDIDRYIIDTTTGNSNEQYILFANYQFNV